MGLRISRHLADRVAAAGDEIDANGPLALVDQRQARALATGLASGAAQRPISAGRLSATVELARVLRRRLDDYFATDPELLDRLLGDLIEGSTPARLRAALRAFESAFLGASQGASAREALASGEKEELGLLLREAILIWALDVNPAAAPVSRELQGPEIWSDPDWQELVAGLSRVLLRAPPLDRRATSLEESLRAPALVAPDSIADQLRFLLDDWSDLAAGERAALVASLDLIAEEEAPRFPPGPGPIELPDYDDFDDGEPNYSSDLDWMEPLVLIAKNSYVWLDQLSTEYGEAIERLNQIPDRELDRLAERGISGLWLIGIWERSTASAEIKRRLGNPEALASAYSLRDYEIAHELGGVAAIQDLAGRAAERGIRLAADMVPNHMGMDSHWLIEHPERFLSVERCPFPGYTFDGPDLSSDPRVGIYLEDHYYDRTDAAVVFKRVDRRRGEERYVYHGNDGTSTPWNDTAQLDFLNPETRAAVMDTILRVAEAFPIIRFDAAMTLARRHVKRLWYPEPGAAGAIPSRSEHSLSAAEFKRAMPAEFWREVVDTVAARRADTLLLAEAFWLMEGYFVRTLGMHRVYNSAFMNLLRDGETAKLRRMIRETLGFDPEILKRHVNFLSNPDEKSAIEQFGSGDRYFGACVTMATLPGLPMVAHGQFEGLREKYGMEFHRPRLDERTDPAVLGRHRREIFPLLRRRDRYAGVDDFLLLDLLDERGGINEHVLAYANGREIDRSIVLFNNSDTPVAGHLPAVASVLDLDPESVYRFRDRTSGLYYLVTAEQLAPVGLRVELAPFESRVLLDFRPVLSTVSDSYRALAERLEGRGVANVEVELELLDWQPAIAALGDFFAEPAEVTIPEVTKRLEDAAQALGLDVAEGPLRAALERVPTSDDLQQQVEALPWPESRRMQDARRRLVSQVARGGDSLRILQALLAVAGLQDALGGEPRAELARRIVLELSSGRPPGLEPVLALALEEDWTRPQPTSGRSELLAMLERWRTRDDTVQLLGLNEHGGEEWVRKEELELLLRWRGLVAVTAELASVEARDEAAVGAFGWLESLELLRKLFESEGYALGRVRERLSRPARGTSGGSGARAEGRRAADGGTSSRPPTPRRSS